MTRLFGICFEEDALMNFAVVCNTYPSAREKKKQEVETYSKIKERFVTIDCILKMSICRSNVRILLC